MRIHFETENSAISKEVESFIKEWESPSDDFVVTTSGSTGVPKRIRVQKKFARASAAMTLNFLKLKEKQSALLCLHPSTIAGKMMIVRSIVGDLDLYVVEPSAEPLRDLEIPMDFIAMVPYQLVQSIKNTTDPFFESQKIIVGGAPIDASMLDLFQKIPATVYHTFGMTETISHIALRNLTNGEQAYQALPGVELSGVNGQLCIDAPHIGVQELMTNDCVSMVDTVRFVWEGRADFVINSGGIKIHPEKIEAILSKEFDCPLFVMGIPDAQLGEKMVLCMESPRFELEKVQLSLVLPKFHVPKAVYFFSKFQRTASGKINRLETLKEGSYDEKPLL